MLVQFVPQPKNPYCSFDRSTISEEEASKTTKVAKKLFPDLSSYDELDYKTLKVYLKREEIVTTAAFHLNVDKQPRPFVIATVKAMKSQHISVDAINLYYAINNKDTDLLNFLLNNVDFSVWNGSGIALKNPLNGEDSLKVLSFYKLVRFAIEHGNLDVIKCLTEKIPYPSVSLRNLKTAFKRGDCEIIDFLADIIDEQIKKREIPDLEMHEDRQSMHIENEGACEIPSFGDIVKAIARADIESVRIYLEKTPPSKWHLTYAELKEVLDLETQEVKKEDPFEISRLIRTKL